MNKQDIQLLYKYNSWANKRILDAAANVTAGTIPCARFISARRTAQHAYPHALR